jgi:soluble lytic murein transglycosylase
MRRHCLSVLLAAALVAGSAATQRRPTVTQPQAPPTAAVDPQLTSSVAFPEHRFVAVREAPTASIAELKAGLDALAAGDVMAAGIVRDGLAPTALDRHILQWAIAMFGGSQVSSSDIEAAAQTLIDWPGTETLRRNAERALAREKPDPATVVAAFSGSMPQTLAGTVLLARAELSLGNPDAARAVLSPFWRKQKLEPGDEAAVIREFGKIIPAADHRFRMERMLYAERARSADRVAALAGASELAAAWSAVLRGDSNAGKLLDAVPADQRSAGFYFAEAKYLRRNHRFAEAAAAMLKAPGDAAALVDPDAWWIERRVLSRELVDAGDMPTAYKIVAAHAGESPANAVDAEFHAGWYAFRGLNDPQTGARHFARIAAIADGPISRARGYYWLGRAAEAGGPGDAEAYYKLAAGYPTAFYGQLAAQKIGRTHIALGSPEATQAEKLSFAGHESVHAIRRLEQAGYDRYADMLYRDLATQLGSAGQLALLTGMAEQRGDHYLALRIAKLAASRGIDIGALAHPVGAIPTTADMSSAGEALAYAIARQESEFNVGAVSGAGARGLLQLLPGTARDVAKRAGLPYSQERLTTDAGYNATLGAAFLGEQLGRFDGSYVLTFAGYNAGPRRAREWVNRYGDPRGKDIDTVVDWIERIPYSETRSYVQRVMENYQVYKMRLAGSFDIVADLCNGR